jgi:cyclopropane-fatty-acyl-phospholipid synthase
VRARTTSFTTERAGAGSTFVDRWCLHRIARSLDGAELRLQLWDGHSVTTGPNAPVATIAIGDRSTLLGLLFRPELEFGEAYAAGRIDVEGPLVRALEAVARALARGRKPERIRLGPTTETDSRHNVHAHYDIGNDFYRLWLDSEGMLYTCAYFESPGMSLEAAQRAKLDHVCRKLRLRPGETVVEAGCGWGALALHMAREYGVTVRAYNISKNQLAYAREQAERQGLSDRVTFIDGDYRSISGRADAFVSVGMLEHVGPRNYEDLGRVIDEVIDPEHGRGLLHFIGRNAPMTLNAWIRKRVFPGAHPPSLGEVLPPVLEARQLSVTDIENLRLHYALTLDHWLQRFEQHAETVRQMFDEEFVRTWRLYLAGSQAAFLAGDMQLFQVTFGRRLDNSQPWTRRDLYEASPRDHRAHGPWSRPVPTSWWSIAHVFPATRFAPAGLRPPSWRRWLSTWTSTRRAAPCSPSRRSGPV